MSNMHGHTKHILRCFLHPAGWLDWPHVLREERQASPTVYGHPNNLRAKANCSHVFWYHLQFWILNLPSSWRCHSVIIGERSANLGLAKTSTRLYVWTHKVTRFCLAAWYCQNVFLWEHSHCSHGIRRINIIHWQIAGSILSKIKTSMKCRKGHRHQKLRLRLGQPTGRLNFALQTRR